MKDIPGYEGLYSIDENGNVFSHRTKKSLKPCVHNGYLQVGLIDTNGKRKQLSIHRLVALTYIPNLNKLPVVDHIDRNKLNNSVENLRWTSYQENLLNQDWEQIHENYRNMSEEVKKERTHKANQVTSKPVEMRDKNNHDILIKIYPSTRQAAVLEFGDVGKNSNISQCACGKRKSAYGYFWKYVNSDASCEEET